VDRDLALRAQNAKLVEDATAVELSAMGKVAQATDAQLAKAEEIRAQRLENARGDNYLKLQAEEEFQAANTAIQLKYETERTELYRKQSEERERITEEEERRRAASALYFSQTTLGALQDTFSGMSQLAAESGSKEQARNLFKVAKVTGAAVTLVNTYVAAQKALAELGPIAGPVAATALTASGLTRVALIRNQKMPAFYRGTSMVQRVDGGAGDAVPSVLHEGEAVLNRRAADTIGRRQIDALNAGSSSSAPMVVAVSQINHRQFRSFYRDDRQLPGSLTRGDRNRSGSRIGRQL
jgi:Flp pilus assembly protein TadB